MSIDDFRWSSAMHRTALSSGLFPRLGPRFIRAYHRSFVESPHGVALAVEVDGRPVGFVLGVLDDRAHYRYVLRHHGIGLGIRAVAAMGVRPRVLALFVRTRASRYLRGARKLLPSTSRSERTGIGGGAPPTRSKTTVVHIAIDPSMRGLGLGRDLLDTFETIAGALGTDRVEAATEHASGFYLELGWIPVSETSDLDGNRHTVLHHAVTARDRLSRRPSA
jgi:GNAT superfamily N-acetyltransferase